MPRRNKRKHKGAEPGTLGAGGGKGGPGENWGGEHMRQAPRPLIAVNPDRTLIAVAFETVRAERGRSTAMGAPAR